MKPICFGKYFVYSKLKTSFHIREKFRFIYFMDKFFFI